MGEMSTEFTFREYDGGCLEWWPANSTAIYWRSSAGSWHINFTAYSFDRWIELVKLPEEEKVWIKLMYG
jgi:hypothetical protein